MFAIGVLDDQLAAVVAVRLGQEQRGRQVGADAGRRAGRIADGVVHVQAEGLAFAVDVEQLRKDARRQRGRHEERIAGQALVDQRGGLQPLFGIGGQLQVVLHQGGLEAGSATAVLPVRLLQQVAGSS